MVPTCGHLNVCFRITVGKRHMLMCFECVVEEIQESQIDHPILFVRLSD